MPWLDVPSSGGGWRHHSTFHRVIDAVRNRSQYCGPSSPCASAATAAGSGSFGHFVEIAAGSAERRQDQVIVGYLGQYDEAGTAIDGAVALDRHIAEETDHRVGAVPDGSEPVGGLGIAGTAARIERIELGPGDRFQVERGHAKLPAVNSRIMRPRMTHAKSAGQ